jgi:hypothetical protein
LPRLAQFRAQALQNFRELVAKRSLDTPTTSTLLVVRPDPDPTVAQAPPVREPAAWRNEDNKSAALAIPTLAGLGSLMLGGAAILLARLAMRRLRNEA